MQGTVFADDVHGSVFDRTHVCCIRQLPMSQHDTIACPCLILSGASLTISIAATITMTRCNCYCHRHRHHHQKHYSQRPPAFRTACDTGTRTKRLTSETLTSVETGPHPILNTKVYHSIVYCSVLHNGYLVDIVSGVGWPISTLFQGLDGPGIVI